MSGIVRGAYKIHYVGEDLEADNGGIIMASMKAKKGNPFERLVAYNLQELGYEVNRIDDNTAGVDLIAKDDYFTYYIECKHHKGFTWNALTKIFHKTDEIALEAGVDGLLIFRANNQPVCIMYYNRHYERIEVTTFTQYFRQFLRTEPEWKTPPKGYKVWEK